MCTRRLCIEFLRIGQPSHADPIQPEYINMQLLLFANVDVLHPIMTMGLLEETVARSLIP